MSGYRQINLEKRQDRPGEVWAVVRCAGDWKIISRTGSAGRYDHKVDAEEAALRLRSRAHARGAELTVFVQSASGELEVLDGAG